MWNHVKNSLNSFSSSLISFLQTIDKYKLWITFKPELLKAFALRNNLSHFQDIQDIVFFLSLPANSAIEGVCIGWHFLKFHTLQFLWRLLQGEHFSSRHFYDSQPWLTYKAAAPNRNLWPKIFYWRRIQVSERLTTLPPQNLNILALLCSLSLNYCIHHKSLAAI